MVRLANQVVTEVRQRTQQDVMGHRGRKGDPLYDIRRLLLVGEERLSGSARRRIDAALAHPDGDRLRRGRLRLGSQRTLLREVYAAENLVAARKRLEAFHGWAETVDVPEVDRLSRTLRTWEEETLNYHRTGATNGPTEAVNLIIEKTRRLGHGFRNWDNYRLRLLLHCGVTWYTAPTKRIRGRKPPLAA
ncbi:MAG: transposase [bacterium]|nr:transposase [bacterium]